MRHFITLLILLSLFSCKNSTLKDLDYYKTGTFKTILSDKNITSTATRNDTLQIETYEGKKDTFYIKWKNNFEYILTHKNPKTALDSVPFHVKITGFDGDNYSFKAFYQDSNFKQKGTATKINK
ncbi:MAG: DNA topoisomerase IV [Flavobacteriaceae bacterium]